MIRYSHWRIYNTYSFKVLKAASLRVDYLHEGFRISSMELLVVFQLFDHNLDGKITLKCIVLWAKCEDCTPAGMEQNIHNHRQ